MPKTLHLLEMKVGRDAQGAYLSIRSDVDWTPLKDTTPTPAINLGGVANLGGVDVTMIKLVQIPGMIVANDVSNSKLFIGDSKPNVAFLGATKLKEGVTFRITGPVSLERMKNYTTALRTYVRGLYAEHMKPIDVSCTVTVTETEKL
jgi:hypothetical protein